MNQSMRRPTRSHQPDPNCGFRDSSVPSHFTGRHPQHLKFEQLTFARSAEFQNAGYVNRRRVYSQPAMKLRQGILEPLFRLPNSPIHVQGDAIHPGEQHLFIAKLI
jgi:hypothetical protein